MPKLCVIAFPTRKRVDRLRAAIASIIDNAKDPSRIEFVIRIDDCDGETLGRFPDIIEEFKARSDVRSVVGPRRGGYSHIHQFYTEAADASDAQWDFCMNDDAVLQGFGWDEKLAEVPLEGFIVQPETMQLGLCSYYRSHGAFTPIVPNKIWKKFGLSQIPSPVDTGLDRLLRNQHGWQTHFLPGIVTWHQRDTDEVLNEHRKIEPPK